MLVHNEQMANNLTLAFRRASLEMFFIRFNVRYAFQGLVRYLTELTKRIKINISS